MPRGAEREAGGDGGEGILEAQLLGAELLGEEALETRDPGRAAGAEDRIDLVGGDPGGVQCAVRRQRSAWRIRAPIRASNSLRVIGYVDRDRLLEEGDLIALASRQADLGALDLAEERPAIIAAHQGDQGAHLALRGAIGLVGQGYRGS